MVEEVGVEDPERFAPRQSIAGGVWRQGHRIRPHDWWPFASADTPLTYSLLSHNIPRLRVRNADRPFSNSERFEELSILIFLSYIFLLSKPKQENVGEKNKSGW